MVITLIKQLKFLCWTVRFCHVADIQTVAGKCRKVWETWVKMKPIKSIFPFLAWICYVNWFEQYTYPFALSSSCTVRWLFVTEEDIKGLPCFMVSFSCMFCRVKHPLLLSFPYSSSDCVYFSIMLNLIIS